MTRNLIAVAAVLLGLSFPCFSVASEPGWVGQVIKPASQREQIRNTPIINRPYRPLHFYGNTVRRMYYHGRMLPGARDLNSGMRAFSENR